MFHYKQNNTVGEGRGRLIFPLVCGNRFMIFRKSSLFRISVRRSDDRQMQGVGCSETFIILFGPKNKKNPTSVCTIIPPPPEVPIVF